MTRRWLTITQILGYTCVFFPPDLDMSLSLNLLALLGITEQLNFHPSIPHKHFCWEGLRGHSEAPFNLHVFGLCALCPPCRRGWWWVKNFYVLNNCLMMSVFVKSRLRPWLPHEKSFIQLISESKGGIVACALSTYCSHFLKHTLETHG